MTVLSVILVNWQGMGFEPTSLAQQLGMVFINVGLLPITVLACASRLVLRLPHPEILGE